VDGPREQFAAIGAALEAAGARRVEAAAWHARRIEWGWPLYGVDITDKNLAQEVARDRWAISFVKGCYLGQETVARIDALGHVNRNLVGVRFEGSEAPAAGAELTREGKVAGQVTSACYSPRLAAPLALAYVRRESNAPGVALAAGALAGEVVRLPIDAQEA
jgi:folate-binding protein YgfZ